MIQNGEKRTLPRYTCFPQSLHTNEMKQSKFAVHFFAEKENRKK